MGENQLIDFTWQVEAGGYEWLDTKSEAGEPGRWLVNADPLKPPSLANVIDDSPTLFRTFAGLELTEDAVLNFANQFGLLRAKKKVVTEGGETRRGQPWDEWEAAILGMRGTLDLWEALTRGDTDHMIELTKDRPISLAGKLVGAAGMAPYRGWTPPGGLKGSSIVEPTDPLSAVCNARTRIAVEVNEHLKGAVGPVAVIDPTGELRSALAPKDLLAALWFQFWENIESENTHKKCPACKEWFEIRGDKNTRHNRKFCSNKCRTAAYKKRTLEKKRDGLQMIAGGKKPAAIAKALDVKVATVREWVAKGEV